jgi:hypothetical protein
MPVHGRVFNAVMCRITEFNEVLLLVFSLASLLIVSKVGSGWRRRLDVP